MNKLILTDCDGVLLNWVDAFERWMTHTKGYKKVRDDAYYISKSYDIPIERAKELTKEFCDSSEIGYLKPFNSSAVDFVRRLHFVHGYRLTVISSISDKPTALGYRCENLYRVFGPECFDEIICLPCGGDKTSTLDRWRGTNLWWIEDKPENAVIGQKLGLRPLLVNHPYNLTFPTDIPRVDLSWLEIYLHILEAK